MSEVLYFILTIGILVFIHEFGHFAAAKLSKMRVDAFAIGFGYRLFGWNKLKGFSFGELPKDFDGLGNTDYRLCLLPLGGYVKIAGMVDESADTSFADKPAQEWEFRSKSTSKKVFVITAGVLMNLALALLIFWSTAYIQGKKYIKTTTVGYVAQNSTAAIAGFQTNDKILTVNNKSVAAWDDVRNEIFIVTLGKDINVQVKRNGKDTTIQIARKNIPQDDINQPFLTFAPTQTVVESVMPDMPGAAAGIQRNDIILSIDSVKISAVAQTIEMISACKGKTLAISVLRNSKDTVNLNAAPNDSGKLGLALANSYTGDFEAKNFTLLESIAEGTKSLVNMSSLTFVMIKRVIFNEVAFKNVFGGPIKIAQVAAKSADSGISSFILFLGYLSLNLALLNILPIPALDGGHLIMILIERIMKREIPIKIKIAIQNTGMVLLLLLMAFILFNDFSSLKMFR